MAGSTILEREINRWKKIGLGVLPAIATLYAFFFIFPRLLKPAYVSLMTMGYSEQFLLVMGNFLTHKIIFWGSNLILLIIYKAQLPFFEQYKANDYDWPWNTKTEEWRPFFNKVLLVVVFNITILSPFVLCVDAWIIGEVSFRFELESYPEAFEVIWQTLFFIVVEDVAFYWAHRILHTKYLYGKIHKIHHENRFVHGITSEYAHPLEYVFANGFPSALGPKLLGSRCHIVTFWLWVTVRISETVDGHSGFDFPWSPFRLLPMATNGRYHDYHHAENIGNYGSFMTIWDTVFGTNNKYYQASDAKKAKASQASETKKAKAN